MDLLLLGGTAFLGRAIATEALSRGHAVTCLARGTAPVPVGATLVRADRDADDGLAPVARRRWDAVVDLTRQPGHARRAVRDLDAAHWLFVSSGNVYARFDRPEQGEASELLPPLQGDVMGSGEDYGAAKVACEEAYRTAESWTIVRSGLIGGGGDASGRLGYYPWRLAHPTGDDVLVPGDLDFPVAVIDVADLAAWLVSCAERGTGGVFNATGVTTTLGELLETARDVAGSEATPRPVPVATLRENGVGAWMGPRSLPLWIDDEDWRWFATLDTTAARAAGLVTRPLRDTLAAALAYEERRTEPRGTGLTDDEERELRERLGSSHG